MIAIDITETEHLPWASSLAADAPHAQRLGRLMAVCVSPGGIPKLPLNEVSVGPEGLAGDGRNHAKHLRPDRAISIFDLEILEQLVREGFPLESGTAGENLLVEGLDVQSLTPGTVLEIGDVLLELKTPRKPCYVLDAVDPRLKDAILGRCGYMASVLRGGTLRPGMAIRCRPCEADDE
jgi:MOSC domain-containing protein YiiM